MSHKWYDQCMELCALVGFDVVDTTVVLKYVQTSGGAAPPSLRSSNKNSKRNPAFRLNHGTSRRNSMGFSHLSNFESPLRHPCLAWVAISYYLYPATEGTDSRLMPLHEENNELPRPRYALSSGALRPGVSHDNDGPSNPTSLLRPSTQATLRRNS